MDVLLPRNLPLAVDCLSQQSLTDEAIRDLTINPAPAQNWVAGAGKNPVEWSPDQSMVDVHDTCNLGFAHYSTPYAEIQFSGSWW